MAKTKNIEVIVAEKGRNEGEGRKDTAAPPKEGEVDGRYARGRWVTCPHCGALRYIVEETGCCYDYTYICGNCGQDYFPY